MDAREGFVYLVDTEEIVIEPEPEKRWSLYGEEQNFKIFEEHFILITFNNWPHIS